MSKKLIAAVAAAIVLSAGVASAATSTAGAGAAAGGATTGAAANVAMEKCVPTGKLMVKEKACEGKTGDAAWISVPKDVCAKILEAGKTGDMKGLPQDVQDKLELVPATPAPTATPAGAATAATGAAAGGATTGGAATAGNTGGNTGTHAGH